MSVTIATNLCDCNSAHPTQVLATLIRTNTLQIIKIFSIHPEKRSFAQSLTFRVDSNDQVALFASLPGDDPHSFGGIVSLAANTRYNPLHPAARSTYSYRESSPAFKGPASSC